MVEQQDRPEIGLHFRERSEAAQPPPVSAKPSIHLLLFMPSTSHHSDLLPPFDPFGCARYACCLLVRRGGTRQRLNGDRPNLGRRSAAYSFPRAAVGFNRSCHGSVPAFRSNGCTRYPLFHSNHATAEKGVAGLVGGVDADLPGCSFPREQLGINTARPCFPRPLLARCGAVSPWGATPRVALSPSARVRPPQRR